MRRISSHLRFLVVAILVCQMALGAAFAVPGSDELAVLAQEGVASSETASGSPVEESTNSPTFTSTHEAMLTPEPTVTATPTLTPTATEIAEPIVTTTPVDRTVTVSVPELPASSPLPTVTPTFSATVTESPQPSPAPTATPEATTNTTKYGAAAVAPSLTLPTYSGHVGESVQVGISGFPAGVRVAIYFDASRKTTLVTSSAVAASGVITLPKATAGLHIVKANGGGKAVLKNFRIRPAFKLSLSTVQAGKSVAVTLTGFAGSSATKIRLYEINGSTTVLSVWSTTTDSTGSRTQTFTTKSSLTAGKHRVVSTDAAGNSTATYLTTTVSRPKPSIPDDPDVSQVYTGGTSGRREVALTFDAGSDRGYTVSILNLLADYGIKASFGVTGLWAQENPDLIRRMVSEGHMLINHTWDHPSFTVASASGDIALTEAERLDQLDRTAALIRSLTGGYELKPYYRPPYGDIDDSVLRDAADGGYTATVMWTCDSLGWNGASVDEIVARCGLNSESGDLILMHVGSDSVDGAALPELIEVLLDKGFKLVTVEQLLQ